MNCSLSQFGQRMRAATLTTFQVLEVEVPKCCRFDAPFQMLSKYSQILFISSLFTLSALLNLTTVIPGLGVSQ